MRLVQVEDGFGGAKGLAELNQNIVDEKKEARGGVINEGKGLPEEDGLRIIGDTDDANCRRAASFAQAGAETHRVQPQPRGQVVCWDRFLPVRSLKVLLVESDDSTRHVVTALLRNCSYEVLAVSNGIAAWKILEDLNYQIDLVLTEVVMSGLSGIGLLSKIMSHRSCQNVPVIMMSSYDSMGIVLKCLSNGAADFLVKPIRKNELKNLWQHVWRRCHSSSGSGSESGIRIERSAGAKSAEASDNNTGSNDEDDNRSLGLQVRDGSDNGSGTQSSWTKRAAEVESPRPQSMWDQLAEPADSTCAQVIYPRSEAFASSWVHVPLQEHSGQENQLEKVSMGKDLEIGIPRNLDSQLKGPCKKVTLETSTEKKQSSQADLNLKKDGRNFGEKLDISNDKHLVERINQAVSLPRDIVSCDEHQRGSIGSEIPTVQAEILKGTDKVMENVKGLPSLELSLKRLGDVTQASIDFSEQNILRRSELSAFTRYNTGSTFNQGQIGNAGSCSPLDNSSEAAKPSNFDSTPNQNSSMGSTTDRSFTKPVAAADKASSKSMVKCSHQTSAFQPVRNAHESNTQLMASDEVSARPVNVVQQDNGIPQQVQIQHPHHYEYHLHHKVEQQLQVPTQDELSLKNMSGTAPRCGSSETARAPTETTAADCSLNGSACGSNHGSNLHNGSSAALDAERMNKVNNNGVAASDGGDDGTGSGSGVGGHQTRSATREAALSKFRQKRKERCFEKKVRYQSRKKLAEQRPRVRGQFVRQMQ